MKSKLISRFYSAEKKYLGEEISAEFLKKANFIWMKIYQSEEGCLFGGSLFSLITHSQIFRYSRYSLKVRRDRT